MSLDTARTSNFLSHKSLVPRCFVAPGHRIGSVGLPPNSPFFLILLAFFFLFSALRTHISVSHAFVLPVLRGAERQDPAASLFDSTMEGME